MAGHLKNFQTGILAGVPCAARYLTFAVANPRRLRPALAALAAAVDGESVVMGVGANLVDHLGAAIDGLRPFPRLRGAKVQVPTTPAVLWCWLRGEDQGELLHRSRAIEAVAGDAFKVDSLAAGFRHREGRDLTGYVDGTENPKGAKASRTAIVTGKGAGLDGSSFVAVQRWQHDFEGFDAMSMRDQDNAIGRRRRDNVELAGAPVSAHVKRTAQESFEPEAFVVRRSMPWVDGQRAGLMFVAFGASFDAFEAQMRRMAGVDDGVVDALFRFTRPLTGAYYWCPPVKRGKLDVSSLLT